MTHKETGGPAYPVETAELLWKGMTLREYFAGQALPSLLSNSDIEEVAVKKGMSWVELVAEISYHMADAMIAARDAE